MAFFEFFGILKLLNYTQNIFCRITGPSGQYEIMNEGYIAAFKIACDVIDDEEFKADAKNFAIEGKKLQELYNFCEPEPGVWAKRQDVDQCIDNLIDNRNSRGFSRG